MERCYTRNDLPCVSSRVLLYATASARLIAAKTEAEGPSGLYDVASGIKAYPFL